MKKWLQYLTHFGRYKELKYRVVTLHQDSEDLAYSQNEHNVSTIETIYNALEKYRSQMHADRSEMQVYHTNDMTNELEDLFFAYQTSLNIWRAFPQVLTMDATYKTNKTTLGGYDGPYVIVTDRELILMNACANVFLEFNRLLCRWHISESIKKPYKPIVFNYLNQTWLDKHKEMFVSLWTNRVLHFDNHANNKVESQHARFKDFVDSNYSKLHRFFDYIDKTIQSQCTSIKGHLEKSIIEVKHSYNIEIF
uniref:Protein FAR1-RELATED SEQUENCE n=1 Tax=Lactuca sativa TaxID=4236 RepID=A0A9R1WLG3_LACSA|nr:hypothetical protein LSAT_V11C100038920 [Lactuca sativa]